MMPPGGAPARAEQMAALSVLLHELRTDPALGDLLDEAEAGGAGTPSATSCTPRLAPHAPLGEPIAGQ